MVIDSLSNTVHDALVKDFLDTDREPEDAANREQVRFIVWFMSITTSYSILHQL